MILDAGYELPTKEAILSFTSEHRSDIAVVFDECDFKANSLKGTDVTIGVGAGTVNHAVYTQKLIVNDVISGKDIWVTPTYFLASLIPFNDRIYGMQWPTAGLTRGVLTGVKGINFNPTEEQNNNFILKRINYRKRFKRLYFYVSIF